MTESVKLLTRTRRLNHSGSAAGFYQTVLLRQAEQPSALLETAEVNQTNHRSIVMASACLRVTATVGEVAIQALNGSGELALEHISTVDFGTRSEGTGAGLLTVKLSAPEVIHEEQERLKAPSSLDVLRKLIAAVKTLCDTPELVYFPGCFSYDLVRHFEDFDDDHRADIPDFEFFLADQLLLKNHENQVTLVVHQFVRQAHSDIEASLKLDELHEMVLATGTEIEAAMATNDLETVSVVPDRTEFCDQVKTIKQHILEGDIFQCVISRQFQVDCSKPFAAYLRLRESNPSPYMFYLVFGTRTLFGASPESSVAFDSNTRRVNLYPIAGTRRRPRNELGEIDLDMDAMLEYELKSDEKENAEHMMLVDLARNDLARIATPGSRKIDQLLEVVRYSHVMHLVSRVSAELAPGLDALDAYRACLNMGTLVGAPKVRASAISYQMEAESRGHYGGAVGYLRADGAMDTAIVIRSAVVENHRAVVQAGAGIVADSIPEMEADETTIKASAVLAACGLDMSRRRTL